MPWIDFFPFATGADLSISAEYLVFSATGVGRVILNDENVLNVEYQIPRQKVLGFSFGPIDGYLEIEYIGEGAMNRARIKFGDEELHDSELIIYSSLTTFRRTIESSENDFGKEWEFSIRKRAKNTAEFYNFIGFGNLPPGVLLKFKNSGEQ